MLDCGFELVDHFPTMKTSQLKACRISDWSGYIGRYMRKNTKGSVFKLNQAYYYYRPGHFSTQEWACVHDGLEEIVYALPL